MGLGDVVRRDLIRDGGVVLPASTKAGRSHRMDSRSPAELGAVDVAGVAPVESDSASNKRQLAKVGAGTGPGQINRPGTVVEAENVGDPAHRNDAFVAAVTMC